MCLGAGRKEEINSGDICPRVHNINPSRLPWWQRAFDKLSESAEVSACKKAQTFLGRIGRIAAYLEKSRC